MPSKCWRKKFQLPIPKAAKQFQIRIHIGGKEIKLSLFGDNMIMDRKPKRINNNFQNPTTKFGKRI